MSKEKDKIEPPIFVETQLPAVLEFEPHTLVHPALDFKKETAYVGIALPCRSFKGMRILRPYLVTETEMFEITNEELEKHKIDLAHRDLPGDITRWSVEGIKRFLKEKEKIEPEKIYKSIKSLFLEYIDFQDPRHYDLITLWNIGTYFFPLFEAYPYLHVNGMADTGKTRLLIVCQHIAFNAILGGSFSGASLYRKVQSSRCTVFIDENEELVDPTRSQEFRRLLLNGYKRGPKVVRCNMNTTSFTPESYEVYSPKILASISPLDNVLGSRCISILSQATSKKEIASREVKQDNPCWQEIRDMLYPFLFRNWRTIQQSYEELKNETELNNRDWEIWRPIFALARVFCGDIHKEMLQLALEKAEERKSEQGFTPEAELAQTLLQIVDKDDFYRLKLIKEYIEAEYQYKTLSWLTEKYIGNMLRKFGFPKPKRDSKGFKYYLIVTKVREIAEQLGIEDEHSERSVGPKEG
jgi:hypothetical protein